MLVVCCDTPYLSSTTKFILTILSNIFISQVFGQFKPQGTYVGLEKMTRYENAAKPNYKWYHLSVLTFKGDSVFLDQSPIAIYKKDTIFSTSDGGFYYYKGKLKMYQGKTIADFALDSCAYCPNLLTSFTPPKLVREDGTVSTNYSDTATILLESNPFENPNTKYKIMTIEKTKSSRTIRVDKTFYRQQNKK